MRYVIETLPLAGISIAYGASTLGRLLGWRGALAAALSPRALVTAVEATRGARLPTTATGATLGGAEVRSGRSGRVSAQHFARNDLFLGYDEAFATGVLSPGRRCALLGARHGALRAAADRALAEAAARPDRARLVRRPARDERRSLRAVPLAALGGLEVATFRTFVLCSHARAVPTPAAFARAGLRVFEAARELSAPARAPSRQAAVTAEALRGALPDLR